MLPNWNDLELYNVDLHFHAGTERQPEYSAHDFVRFAAETGRRIVGLTDHWGRYLGMSQKPLNHYPGTLDGYRAFAADVHAARESYPEVIVLLGPEAGFEHLRDNSVADALLIPPADYFLAECGGGDSGQTYGDYLIDGMAAAARVRDRYDCPGFLAHPLRSAINTCVGKTGPGPQFPKQPPLPPLAGVGDQRRHVEALFDIDIDALAEASARYDIPIEVNRSSWRRMIGMNQQPFVERYLYFYRGLIDSGASMILGSDLHGIESVAPTPFIAAQLMGLEPKAMTFLRHWLGDCPD
jgi:hypothetical protein